MKAYICEGSTVLWRLKPMKVREQVRAGELYLFKLYFNERRASHEIVCKVEGFGKQNIIIDVLWSKSAEGSRLYLKGKHRKTLRTMGSDGMMHPLYVAPKFYIHYLDWFAIYYAVVSEEEVNKIIVAEEL